VAIHEPVQTGKLGVSPASVTISEVNKHFGKGLKRVDVLRDINLDIHAGEVLVLLGPSGCGKSTLLRLIAGLDSPSEGKVEVDGVEVSGVDVRCGFVFQEPRLLPWLNLKDNVAIGARGKRSQEEIVDLLASVGLTGFEKHLPKQVSGGMAQRTALARGLAGYPGVLLLDEPFAALDALTRLLMQDLLLEVVGNTGATVVLVTHDIDEALHLADRIVVLAERGRGIDEIVRVNHPKPRDRSHPGLAPLRTELLSKFGIHP
jgi:sulfonate transport system ATP-binding protein